MLMSTSAPLLASVLAPALLGRTETDAPALAYAQATIGTQRLQCLYMPLMCAANNHSKQRRLKTPFVAQRGVTHLSRAILELGCSQFGMEANEWTLPAVRQSIAEPAAAYQSCSCPADSQQVQPTPWTDPQS